MTRKFKSMKNLLRSLRGTSQTSNPMPMNTTPKPSPEEQDLAVYWNPAFVQMLETWGEKTAWHEIEYLIVNCRGKVLDIACGTGKNIQQMARYPQIEIYGCDISEMLIVKAIERGIPAERLKVSDATKTDYENGFFQHAYSIGSLEHCTEQGINQFLVECRRITTKSSFHMIPITKSGRDEGWISPYQSYFHNSLDWWMVRFKAVYGTVIALDSLWQDTASKGVWLICFNEDKV